MSYPYGSFPFDAAGVDPYAHASVITPTPNRAPTSQDIYPPGTIWPDGSQNPAVLYMTPGGGIWDALPVNANIVTAGASPQTNNRRSGQVTFSGVSIAAGATQSFVINNSTLPANAVLQITMLGSTTGAAPSIQSVTNVAGTTTTIVVTNGTGATAQADNLTFIYEVLN